MLKKWTISALAVLLAVSVTVSISACAKKKISSEPPSAVTSEEEARRRAEEEAQQRERQKALQEEELGEEGQSPSRLSPSAVLCDLLRVPCVLL